MPDNCQKGEGRVVNPSWAKIKKNHPILWTPASLIKDPGPQEAGAAEPGGEGVAGG